MAACMAFSCSHEPSYDWSWADGLVKPIPHEYDWFNNKWGLAANYSFEDRDYLFDGANSLRTTVDHTTLEDGQRMLRYLDEEIFPLVPGQLVKETLPATIYLADKVNFTYTDEEYGLDGKHTIGEKTRMLYGDISVSHLTLATSMLDGNPDELRFNILSLILERMMSNTAKWPEPTDFMTPGRTLIRDLAMFEPYYQESLSGDKFYFNIPSGGNEDFTFWNYCGSLRPCRYDNFLYCKFVEDNQEIRSYYVFTYRQDFADMLSMLLLWTPEQIEAHLSTIDGQRHSYVASSSGIEYVYTVDRKTMEDKIALVKKYMKDNFQIIL